MATVYHVSGFLLSNARKVCRFIFGDFFISCDLNKVERVFIIRLNKELKTKEGKLYKIDDYVELDYFKKFWGPQWKIFFTKDEEK